MCSNIERRHLSRCQIHMAWAMAYPDPAKLKRRSSFVAKDQINSGSLAKARAVLGGVPPGLSFSLVFLVKNHRLAMLRRGKAEHSHAELSREWRASERHVREATRHYRAIKQENVLRRRINGPSQERPATGEMRRKQPFRPSPVSHANCRALRSPALFFLLVADREGLVAQRELSLQSDNHPDQSGSRRMLRRKLLQLPN
jgi:hypothetical protein